jgi:hypothetical protein
MQRLFIFAMALWLAGFGAAQAQTSSQATSQAQVGQPTQQAGVAPTTIAPLPPATTAGATQNESAATQPGLPASSASAASDTDPLSVPTSTTSTSGGATTGTATAGTMSAPAVVNPQRAVQLPGEGTNTSTQAPTTSASAASGGAAAGTSSNAACSTAIPTTTGASGGGGLFGAGSIGGC